MVKRRQWGWRPREGSWEEAVLSWHEQVERSFLRRRFEAEQQAVTEHLPDHYAERDEPGALSRSPDKEVRVRRD